MKKSRHATIYLNKTVFDAALDRIRFLFDEFDNVFVNFSGGKDSTVVLNLALMVAEEKNRLPLRVMFLDQEAEWDATIDYVESLLGDPRIALDWLQIPFRIFNATSSRDPWLYCWKPGEVWIREKHPRAVHENHLGVDRFHDIFDHYQYKTFSPSTAGIAGVRAEESPARRAGLVNGETYKGETWGAKRRKGYYTFYPIYDWYLNDVWKAIHDNHWPYNRLYDYMYQYGVPVNRMRVSNINHETALYQLTFLQEIEPETWEKITARMHGISSVGHLKTDFFLPKTLPFMFQTWREYRDHLLTTLIDDPAVRSVMEKQFRSYDAKCPPELEHSLTQVQISAILSNDYHETKLKVWGTAPAVFKHTYKG